MADPAREYVRVVAELEALYPRKSSEAARRAELQRRFGPDPPAYVPKANLPAWGYAGVDRAPLDGQSQRARFVARVAELEALLPGDARADERRRALHVEFGPPEWFFMRDYPREVPAWASTAAEPARVSDRWAEAHRGPNYYQIRSDYRTIDAESKRLHNIYFFQEADDTPAHRRMLEGHPRAKVYYVARKLWRDPDDTRIGVRPAQTLLRAGDKLAVRNAKRAEYTLVLRSAVAARLVVAEVIGPTADAPAKPAKPSEDATAGPSTTFARGSTALDD